MSAEQTETKKLTIDDPLSPQALEKLQQLTNARYQVGDQLLDLKAEEVRLVVMARQIDQEKQKLFEKELLDRGLNPSVPVEVNATTGKITLAQPG